VVLWWENIAVVPSVEQHAPLSTRAQSKKSPPLVLVAAALVGVGQ
jgi:hypothetical protein